MAIYFNLYNKATWPKIDTVFTWLNAMATISHLCKMTVATTRGWHLLQHDNDCHGYYSKTTYIHINTWLGYAHVTVVKFSSYLRMR